MEIEEVRREIFGYLRRKEDFRKATIGMISLLTKILYADTCGRKNPERYEAITELLREIDDDKIGDKIEEYAQKLSEEGNYDRGCFNDPNIPFMKEIGLNLFYKYRNLL